MLPRYSALLLPAAALALLISIQFLNAVHSSTISEARSACQALDPQPLDLPAPAFSLPSLDGKEKSLAAHRGEVILLNFWATWCPPCVEELPSLASLRSKLNGKGITVLTVNVDESTDELRQFITEHQAQLDQLPVLLDPKRRIPALYGTEKFPETFLIDRLGVARYKIIYKRDWMSPDAVACLLSLR